MATSRGRIASTRSAISRRGKLVGLGIHDLDAMTSAPDESGDESGPDWILDSSQSPAQRLVDGSACTRVDQDQIDDLGVAHGTRKLLLEGILRLYTTCENPEALAEWPTPRP